MTAGIGALLDQQMMEAQKLHCSKLLKQLLQKCIFTVFGTLGFISEGA